MQSPWHSICWNYASWSISAEWHSYLLFPILVINYRTRSNKALLATLVVCAGVVGLTDLTSGSGNISNTIVVLLRCLPEFISGIVLYFLLERGCLPKWTSHITLWLSAAILLVFEWVHVPDGIMVCMLGYNFADERHELGAFGRIIELSRGIRVSRLISYSLYMVQMVVALVLMLSFQKISTFSILYKILFVGLCFSIRCRSYRRRSNIPPGTGSNALVGVRIFDPWRQDKLHGDLRDPKPRNAVPTAPLDRHCPPPDRQQPKASLPAFGPLHRPRNGDCPEILVAGIRGFIYDCDLTRQSAILGGTHRGLDICPKKTGQASRIANSPFQEDGHKRGRSYSGVCSPFRLCLSLPKALRNSL